MYDIEIVTDDIVIDMNDEALQVELGQAEVIHSDDMDYTPTDFATLLKLQTGI